MESNQVINHAELSRFEVLTPDGVGFLTYKQRGNRFALIHTEVPEALAGRGIGAMLAKAGLDYARDNGLGVIVICPFVRAYIKRHPEYAGIVVKGLEQPEAN
ncbi:MAG TPA: GNAT family N-acetyltransferase [Anaerolineales bacterium]